MQSSDRVSIEGVRKYVVGERTRLYFLVRTVHANGRESKMFVEERSARSRFGSLVIEFADAVRGSENEVVQVCFWGCSDYFGSFD